MAHPYFVAATVFDDMPNLDKQSDKLMVDRKGEEADNVVDNILEPFTTVPLSTIPAIITQASNAITEGLIFHKNGDLDRGNDLVAYGRKLVTDYTKTITENNTQSGSMVVISSEYQTSPIKDSE